MTPNSNEHLLSRISAIEKHLINLIIPLQEVSFLSEVLRKPLQLESHKVEIALKNILDQMQKFFSKIAQTTRDLSDLESVRLIQESQKAIESQLKSINLGQAFAEIKYIGKRLNNIENILSEMHEKGTKKQIKLEFTCDGYELVKKRSCVPDDIPEIEEDPEENVKALLKTLTERESLVITHRVGLFGEKKKTLEAIGNIVGVQKEIIRQNFNKAIRKCRHPQRKHLAEKITHVEFRKHLFDD